MAIIRVLAWSTAATIANLDACPWRLFLQLVGDGWARRVHEYLLTSCSFIISSHSGWRIVPQKCSGVLLERAESKEPTDQSSNLFLLASSRSNKNEQNKSSLVAFVWQQERKKWIVFLVKRWSSFDASKWAQQMGPTIYSKKRDKKSITRLEP